jgi:hypothetical protein
MKQGIWAVLVLGLIVTLFGTRPAWAYLDPGTGSMMLQVLLGGVAGVLVVGKLYWQRFRQFVTSRFSASSGQDAQARPAARSATTDPTRDGRDS